MSNTISGGGAPEPERLLSTLKRTAAVFDSSVPTIRRMIESGDLEAVKFGSRTMVTATSIAAKFASLQRYK